MLRCSGFPRRDGPADLSQYRAVVEADDGPIRLDTKFSPQSIQVHAHRLVFHSCVQRLKNSHAHCAVSGSERILEIPFLPDVTTGVEYAAKGMLQTLRVVCLAANLNVGQQAKQRSSPIGSPPG